VVVSVGIAKLLAGPVASALADRAKVQVLGSGQRRALQKAVRKAAEAASGRYPSVSHLEIDLLSDPEVIKEVVGAATDERAGEWPTATKRWVAVYGGAPLPELRRFLDDLASELGSRLRGEKELQPIFLVGRTDVLVKGQGEILTHTGALLAKVADLSELTAAMADPVRAIRFDDKLSADLVHGADVIIGALSKMSQGPIGAGVNLEVALTDGQPHLRLNARPGARVEMTLSAQASDTPEGRARLEALAAAMRNNEDLDIPEAEVQLLIDGVPVGLPGRVHATSRPTRRRQRVVLEFKANGLTRERFLIDLETWATPAGELRAESPENAVGPLLVDLTIDQAKTLKLSYRGNPAGASVSRQLKMARLGRHLKRGCRFEVWFVELDVAAGGLLPPQPNWDEADRATKAFALFDEVQRRLGAEIGTIEELTELDISYLRMAKRFLDTGRALWPFSGGTFTAETYSEPHVPDGAARALTADDRRAPLADAHPLRVDDDRPACRLCCARVVGRGRIHGSAAGIVNRQARFGY
jgi:hypothetical protein